MTEYYRKHKTEIEAMHDTGKRLIGQYRFRYCSIRKLDTGIRLSVHDDGDRAAGAYFDPATLKPLPYFGDAEPCKNCTAEENNRYRSFLADKDLKEILQLYSQLDIKAIHVSKRGTFSH